MRAVIIVVITAAALALVLALSGCDALCASHGGFSRWVHHSNWYYCDDGSEHYL